MKKGGKVSAGGMKHGGKVSADMVSPRKAEAMGLSKFNKGGMVESVMGSSGKTMSDSARANVSSMLGSSGRTMSSADRAKVSSMVSSLGGTKRSNEGRR
jgi:hypothetical protein